MLNQSSQLARFAHSHLKTFVNIDTYDFSSCYLWQDSPVYDPFGEKIAHLKGDTIYLNQDSPSPLQDLFHEIGHAVGRKFDVVGHYENHYSGHWDKKAIRLVGNVKRRCHWSQYLNCFALMHNDFETNSQSELWAELFMLWYLYPSMHECVLIQAEMLKLESLPQMQRINRFAIKAKAHFSFEH